MPYIQNTEADQQAMLAAIGARSLEDLFAPIPAGLRVAGALPLDPGLTEQQLNEHVSGIGTWNRAASARPCFLGGGVYDHAWPALVDHLMQRSEFLTAYTPYQPECSQGTLQWIFEFQSMIAELCGLEVANASMYDGASAAAEAALMAVGATGRRRIVVSAGVHPHTREALRTYGRHQDLEMVEAPLRDGLTSWEGLVGADTAAVLVQQPNFLGLVEALDRPAALARDSGALSIAAVYPVALGLLRSPGAAGFDVVVGDGQSLGVPMGYGGPSFGFFAARERFVRRMPGRLVGTTLDRQGRRAFTLTFQTREQHIRREKATSNICTNNALIALRGCIFMAAVGPRGLEEMACVSRQRALELRASLLQVSAIREAFPGQPFFNEIPFRIAGGEPAVTRLKTALQQAGIAAVLPLSRWYPGLEGVFTLACTERTTPQSIAQLAQVAADTLRMEMAL
ncbi:MAG: aminomethyl-transferring glycine dehydrogenase subunit GcvPA [Planctomycetota bacterium]|nr:MAG: aminomethyl-transferring glycine dehydrogenase subunit GcvPA [Planctomycetota bacterium]